MRIRTLLSVLSMLLMQAGTVLPAGAQAPSPDPYGLTALNAAYRLKFGEFSLDMQQGGMPQSAPYIYPLMSARGVELWGKDASFRADHLFFVIRYGLFRDDAPETRVRDTDVPNLIEVSHTSENFTEHLAHQEKLLLVRSGLGAPTTCARDTTLTEGGKAVLVTSSAAWRLEGATVRFATQVTLREPGVGRRPQRPVFAAHYGVLRAGFPLSGGTPTIPARTDAGCSIERDELITMSAPIDSGAFRILRDRLRVK